jgi:hypothetical protein
LKDSNDVPVWRIKPPVYTVPEYVPQSGPLYPLKLCEFREEMPVPKDRNFPSDKGLDNRIYTSPMMPNPESMEDVG